MNFPIFINKFVLNFKPIQRTPFFFWFRLINHDGWRLDDNIRYWDFWNSINQGYDHMNYVYEFEKIWGVGSYPPETIILPAEDFDNLVKKLNEKPKFSQKLYDLMSKKAPWDKNYDD